MNTTSQMSKWDMVKELKGLITSFIAALTVVGVIAFALMEWRISENVSQALEIELAKGEKDIGTDPKIVSMSSDIRANSLRIEANTERTLTTQRQLEAVGQILMNPPQPDGS